MENKQTTPQKPPIINCHTHIFTGDHVPPYLAKTFVFPPLYFLLNLSWIVSGFRIYNKYIKPLRFSEWSKENQKRLYQLKMSIARNWVLKQVAKVVRVWLTVHAFFILFGTLTSITAPDSFAANRVVNARHWLEARHMLLVPSNNLLKVMIVLAVLFFVKSGRTLILFAFKKLWSFFKILPGPQSRALIKRYVNIGRYSFHKEQEENYKRLRNQYPQGTGFIVLPMDMEYMGAGALKEGSHYRDQMAALKKIKEDSSYTHRFFPFVFVDPRRMEKEPDYFVYSLSNDRKIVLKDCFLKSYMEAEKAEHCFSGFKIYPALGYYPFDHKLLPLWKYAADNQIPILTHCIRGTIYYRGAKKKEWDFHPIIEQAAGDGIYEPLLLPQMKNVEFINNFTHPLNFLCLLEETILRKWVGKATDDIKKVFGYKDENTKLESDLSKLKICFGHYGGDDEWMKYLESDLDNYGSQLVKYPDRGIDFMNKADGTPGPGKLEQIWKSVDWYTIITSMMLQYDNVYSDLSYILHSPDIQPLLSKTLQHSKLRKRVLFGTDFYVVRNHKSEKHMLADMQVQLSDAEFDSIARENPREFLNLMPPPPPPPPSPSLPSPMVQPVVDLDDTKTGVVSKDVTSQNTGDD